MGFFVFLVGGMALGALTGDFDYGGWLVSVQTGGVRRLARERHEGSFLPLDLGSNRVCSVSCSTRSICLATRSMV